MATDQVSGWTDIVDGTSAVKRTLAALQIQHETLMAELETLSELHNALAIHRREKREEKIHL